MEVTIAAALSTVIMFGVFGILQTSNRQLEIIHAKMNIQEGPREALFKMAQEIRQTAWHRIDDLSLPDANDMTQSDTIRFDAPIPSPTTLVDGNYAPKWAYGIQYSLDTNNHQILRTTTNLEDATLMTQKVIANEVTDLTFSRKVDSGIITIAVEVQREIPVGNQVRTVTTHMIAQAEARNP